MITQREFLAANLLALSNSAFSEGRSAERVLGASDSARPMRFDMSECSPLSVTAAVRAVPGFVLALRESPMREEFLAAADLILTQPRPSFGDVVEAEDCSG